MPGRPITNLAYFIRFRKGERKAFREFVKAKKALIELHSKRLNVPEILIIEELFHQFTTTTNPEVLGGISWLARQVAQRRGKPRYHSRRRK